MAKKNKVEPWDVVDELRKTVADKYPQYRIGKIELWDLGGKTGWKSTKTFKQWVKELTGTERQPKERT